MLTMPTLQPSRPSAHAALVQAQADDARALAQTTAQTRVQLERDDEHVSALRRELDSVLAQRAERQQCLDHAQRAFDRRTADREAQLRTLADPKIDAFMAWLDASDAALIHQIVIRSGHTRTRDGRVLETTSSNLEAIRLVKTCIVEARRRADALKFETVPDLDAAIERIRATVPTVAQAESDVA